MDHLDKEVIESLSELAKRVFKSLDYRSKQRMLKEAREMAKAEKMKRRKKSRFKKKGIEKLNKGKKQKKGSSSKSERVLFSFHETRELMVQSMHLMLLGSSVADASYEERNTEHTEDAPIRLSKENATAWKVFDYNPSTGQLVIHNQLGDSDCGKEFGKDIQWAE